MAGTWVSLCLTIMPTSMFSVPGPWKQSLAVAAKIGASLVLQHKLAGNGKQLWAAMNSSLHAEIPSRRQMYEAALDSGLETSMSHWYKAHGGNSVCRVPASPQRGITTGPSVGYHVFL